MFNTVKTVLVIDAALFIVNKHFVGFGRLFKLFFCFFISGVFIGVILNCQFAVGFFYFIGGSGLCYAQYLIIISLCQNKLLGFHHE